MPAMPSMSTEMNTPLRWARDACPVGVKEPFYEGGGTSTSEAKGGPANHRRAAPGHGRIGVGSWFRGAWNKEPHMPV
jgi:hypothetical protein